MLEPRSEDDGQRPTWELTPLGEALEKGRLATGLSTELFLARHQLLRRTWDRLLYGGVPKAPLNSTVLRYARAAGVAGHVALELASRTPNGMSAKATALGHALEQLRRTSGENLIPFLRKRRLSYGTWHDLVYGRYVRGAVPRRPWPSPGLVHKYASAVGLDLREAALLADQDRRSGIHSRSPAPAAPGAEEPTPNVAAEVEDTVEPGK